MTEESREDRDLRRGAAFRSAVIAVMVALYGWFMHLPAAPLKQTFLIAAALQLLLIVLKRLVPADQLPQALNTYETVADGITVLLFAVGVLGRIAYLPENL